MTIDKARDIVRAVGFISLTALCLKRSEYIDE